MSVLVQQDPGREREDDHQTRIDERRRTDVRFQVLHLDEPVRDKCQRQPAQKTNHPSREVRAKNVDRRRMMAGDPNRDPTKNDNYEAERGKFQKYSTASHFCTRMPARGEPCVGLAVCIAGRARSPTLNASAAWLV